MRVYLTLRTLIRILHQINRPLQNAMSKTKIHSNNVCTTHAYTWDHDQGLDNYYMEFLTHGDLTVI